MVKAVLDSQFQPMALVVRDFLAAAEKAGAQDIAISIERDNGHISTFKTKIFKDGTGHDDENFKFIERLTKSLLWVRGGWKIVIGGSRVVGEKIKEAYTDTGLRAFDVDFMKSRTLKAFPKRKKTPSPSEDTLTDAVLVSTRADRTEKSARLSTASPFIRKKWFGSRRRTPTRIIIIREFLTR